MVFSYLTLILIRMLLDRDIVVIITVSCVNYRSGSILQ